MCLYRQHSLHTKQPKTHLLFVNTEFSRIVQPTQPKKCGGTAMILEPCDVCVFRPAVSATRIVETFCVRKVRIRLNFEHVESLPYQPPSGFCVQSVRELFSNVPYVPVLHIDSPQLSSPSLVSVSHLHLFFYTSDSAHQKLHLSNDRIFLLDVCSRELNSARIEIHSRDLKSQTL